jgi:hypothetical protein
MGAEDVLMGEKGVLIWEIMCKTQKTGWANMGIMLRILYRCV